MTWFDIYTEFLKNFEKISQLQQDYIRNLERINQLYDESIKRIESLAYFIIEILSVEQLKQSRIN